MFLNSVDNEFVKTYFTQFSTNLDNLKLFFRPSWFVRWIWCPLFNPLHFTCKKNKLSPSSPYPPSTHVFGGMHVRTDGYTDRTEYSNIPHWRGIINKAITEITRLTLNSSIELVQVQRCALYRPYLTAISSLPR